MRDIKLPETSDKSIDISAIDTDTEGMAVGRISYCSDTEMWYFCDNIDNAQFDTFKDTLLELIIELIDTKHIADNFRLLEFYTNDND